MIIQKFYKVIIQILFTNKLTNVRFKITIINLTLHKIFIQIYINQKF